MINYMSLFCLYKNLLIISEFYTRLMGERFIFYSVMTRWVPNQVKRILMGSNFYLLNVEDPLTRDFP